MHRISGKLELRQNQLDFSTVLYHTVQVQVQNLRFTELSEIYILELKYPYNLGTAGTEIPLSLELRSRYAMV